MLKKVWVKIKKEAVLITSIVLLVLSFIMFYKNQVLQNRILQLVDQVQEMVENQSVSVH